MPNQEILRNASDETAVQTDYEGRVIYDKNGQIERWVPGRPPFIIAAEIYNLSGGEIPLRIKEKAFSFLGALGENLTSQGCQVSTEAVANFPEEVGMIINPVYLGELSETVLQGLRGETRDLKACLRENLPEINPAVS